MDAISLMKKKYNKSMKYWNKEDLLYKRTIAVLELV